METIFKRKFIENPESNSQKRVHFERETIQIPQRRKSFYENTNDNSQKFKIQQQRTSTITSNNITRQSSNTKPYGFKPQYLQHFPPKYQENQYNTEYHQTYDYSKPETTPITPQPNPELTIPKQQSTRFEGRTESDETKLTITFNNNAAITTFLRHILSFAYGLNAIRHSEEAEKTSKQLTFVNQTMAACFLEKFKNFDFSHEEFNLNNFQIRKQPNFTITKIQEIVKPNFD